MANQKTATAPAKPWLKSYPKAVPHEMGDVGYPSLNEMFDDACAKHGPQLAWTMMGKSITYKQLHDMSEQVGAWLQAQGLAKGDRVAIMMPNVLQYPVVMLGVLRAGYTVVNVNPLYTPRELEHQLKDSGAKAIVILENFAAHAAGGDRARRR